MAALRTLSIFTLFVFATGAQTPQNEYAGSETCARCHKAIFDTQSNTAMANTWHGSMALSAPLEIDEGKTLHYGVSKVGEHLEFSVTGGPAAEVKAMVGGKRHGVSFLLGVSEVGGTPIERPAMLEARYAIAGHEQRLLLSPGFEKDKPKDFEDLLGRVLSPTFERRCLTCHGKPETLGAGSHGGVRCESCHGPAAAHVRSASGLDRGQPFVKPASLKGESSLEVCEQCHNGLTVATHSDPMPDELLVSNQVPALRNSECFVQSRGKVVCTSCHNPHQDSVETAKTATAVCLSCHSVAQSGHAAICPVNRSDGCAGCHMQRVDSGTFHLTDHWIRTVPDGKSRPRDESLRSQVTPVREFLRLIIVQNEQAKTEVSERLAKGESFAKLAHDLSVDGSAPGGGYIGEMKLAEMDSKLAEVAAHLPYGGISDFVQVGNAWMRLERMPHNFRWEANGLFQEAAALHEQGKLPAAVAKTQKALDVYPYFLRALVLMATLVQEAGKTDRATEILRFAAQSYPKDAMTQFNLGMTLARQPKEQIEALQRAIELDPDMVAAYESLGAALYGVGQKDAAIETFKRGLEIDPLSARLYFNLGLALKDRGDQAGADRAMQLAAKLDPQINARKVP